MGAFADAFAKQLNSAVDKTEKKLTRIAHTAVYNLAVDVIEESPVQIPERWYKPYPIGPAGHYKNNWQIGINSEPSDEISGGDSSGGKAKSRAFDALFSNMTNGKKTIHLVNNVIYAMTIEDDVGINRDTWTYELEDRGISAPGAVLGRTKLNWWYHVQEAKA